jgi:hypothetical protein
MTTVTSSNRYQPLLVSTSKTLVANNTTAAVPIFSLTGTVDVLALYGIVTTVLGSNNTAAFFRLNDQTAQVSITLATGTTLSSAPVGSLILRNALAATALVLKSSAAGAIVEPNTAAAPDPFVPFMITQKTGSITTNIEFDYTTTNTPTTGVIQFFAKYLPVSSGSGLSPL